MARPSRIDAGKMPKNEKIPVRASILRRQGAGPLHLYVYIINNPPVYPAGFSAFFALFRPETRGIFVRFWPDKSRFYC